MITVQTGTIGTVAGTGEPGYSGNGGPATQARLNEPKNISFDRDGNIFIADSENHVIRKVERLTGIITTVAGSSLNEKHPDSSDSAKPENTTEELLVDPLADPSPSADSKFTQAADLSGTIRYVVGHQQQGQRFRGDGGPALAARLNFPSAVVVDREGTLYIADTWNHRIRMIDSRTGIILTLAGDGRARFSGDNGPATSASLNEPVALALDEKNHLFIADQSNNRVRMVDLHSGTITTIAGSGEAVYTGDATPATEAGLAGPSGLALGSEGTLYVADTFNGRIRMVNLETGMISTVVGDGEAFRYQAGVNDGSYSLARPYGISLDHHGHLLITDSDNHLIRKWNISDKRASVIAGNGNAQFSGDGLLPETCSLNFPFGVAIDTSGSIWIADTFNHRIRMIAV